MEASSPFRPQGNMARLMASATVPLSAAVALINGPTSGEVSVLVWNPGALDVYIGRGATPATAASNAVYPSSLGLTSVPNMTLPAPARSMLVWTVSGDPYWAAICGAPSGSFVPGGNTPIMLIPGYGA